MAAIGKAYYYPKTVYFVEKGDTMVVYTVHARLKEDYRVALTIAMEPRTLRLYGSIEPTGPEIAIHSSARNHPDFEEVIRDGKYVRVKMADDRYLSSFRGFCELTTHVIDKSKYMKMAKSYYDPFHPDSDSCVFDIATFEKPVISTYVFEISKSHIFSEKNLGEILRLRETMRHMYVKPHTFDNTIPSIGIIVHEP